jgi:phenylacetate-CoA ligase
MRADIEGRMGLDALDTYGLSEVIGPGVASECIESKDGPVLWEDHFYPEVIDPETGAVLPPTARSMRRMGKIVGRSDDMLIIRGVNLFPTQIEELVLQHGALGGQYQLVVTRECVLDDLQVRCELLPEHAQLDPAPIAGELQQRIKTLVGVSTRVSVELPDSIERTLVGKARRVIDKRAH